MTNLTLGDFVHDYTFHPHLLDPNQRPWDALSHLSLYVRSLVGHINQIDGDVHALATLKGQGIYIGKNSYVDSNALIQAPVFIGENVFIGHSALIRPNSIIGDYASIGHCTEIKDAIIYPRSRAAHFNFIGDSIIGSSVNLGGGTIISNFEFAAHQNPNHTISIKIHGNKVDTGLYKLGAVLGDLVNTGSNSVLSPGSLIGIGSMVYPNVCVRKGLIPDNSQVSEIYYP